MLYLQKTLFTKQDYHIFLIFSMGYCPCGIWNGILDLISLPGQGNYDRVEKDSDTKGGCPMRRLKGEIEMTYKYDPKSLKAEEFINHEEIMESLEFAQKNKENLALMREILEKAKAAKGISHREAALLMECKDPEINAQIRELAKEIKQKFYGNRIVMFAPLYLSNYCVNGCTYCPYHAKNKTIPRVKLTQEQIKEEVIALQDMGHKRLALEAGEDPVNNPLEYILESIKTIYSIKHKNGAIRRVNVNIAATTVENYAKLKEAGIGTYILFQETYNKESYEKLHPTGPKHDYAYHTEAMDRAMQGGIDDVGLGVLFGLEGYLYELVGILMHAEHLEAAQGVGPHTISVPRICPADDIDTNDFSNAVPDEIFEKIVAVIRIAVPYTGMIVSTRESQKTRENVLKLGISQISGGSRTSVGGYTEPVRDDSSAQFDVSDTRTLEEVVNWLMRMGYIPSFCTACYREGRTGDRFMSLLKSGQIVNCCQPNALMTLKEFLEDYATAETKEIGEKLIAEELKKVPNEKVRNRAIQYLEELKDGKRDFRF
jgi:2-iminoacetate synthase